MFDKNVGGLDRTLRIVAGLGLLLGFVLNPGTGWSLLYLLGLIPLATGLMSSCPIYAMLGINSCPAKKP